MLQSHFLLYIQCSLTAGPYSEDNYSRGFKSQRITIVRWHFQMSCLTSPSFRSVEWLASQSDRESYFIEALVACAHSAASPSERQIATGSTNTARHICPGAVGARTTCSVACGRSADVVATRYARPDGPAADAR